MNHKFFQQDFNIREYIATRTLEMKSLSDRSIYKEITQNMLIDLYEYHEQSYEHLLSEIMNEKESRITENPIYIGITSSDEYDETDNFLYPMDESDFLQGKVEITDLNESMEETGVYEIGRFYFDGDWQTLKKFKQDIGKCEGKVITTKNEYLVEFEIVLDEKYCYKMEQLYEAFQFNQRKWFPICTAYLMRFFRINLCKVENKLEGDYQEFQINFLENYEEVKLNIFPIWNLTKRIEPTSIYPKPVRERVIYEHKIFSHFLDEQSTYLLTSNNPSIIQVMRNRGDLLIRTVKEEVVEWELLEIKPYGIGNYAHMLLSNEYVNQVTDLLLDKYQTSVKTKGELVRFLSNLPYSEYIKFVDYKVVKEVQEEFDTYHMEAYEKDEIRTEFERTLIVIFQKAEKEHKFLIDFMSFHVTQVQKLFPEYHCVGRVQ